MNQFLPEEWASKSSENVRSGNFHLLLSNFITSVDFCVKSGDCDKEWYRALEQYHKNFSDDSREEELICLGSALLLTFVQDNWLGPSPEDAGTIAALAPQNDAAAMQDKLLVDNDCLTPCSNVHLLFYSLLTLEFIQEKCKSFWTKLWLSRALFMQQQVLDEKSPALKDRILHLLGSAKDQCPASIDQISILLELARIHVYYGFVDIAGRYLMEASDNSGLRYYFTGALGKRTKFQQDNIAQLVMKVEIKDSITKPVTVEVSEPKNISLDDEVRLETVKLLDPSDDESTPISQQHVAILIGNLMMRKRALPQDELSVEEQKALITRILQSTGSWPALLSTLLYRSHLEKQARRTVERSMKQVQSVLDEINDKNPAVNERLTDFFVSYLPPRREVELMLAEILISLGAIKSALDIALRLEEWETAIGCYNVLQLRHMAKELIETELAKQETPKLLCLLGDATDDVKCYEKAWKLSNHKSARAQRHWANFLYSRKMYEESIEHFELSLSINSLQSDLWFRLGFAALHENKWELSAKAYRRYCVLDLECFEAWNNMARCYCELKQSNRAWLALQEALKIDQTNWRVWDNYMLVSAELKELHEIVRSYHEVLNLKSAKHLDIPVLRTLVNAYNDLADNTQKAMLVKKILELFGRLTSQIVNDVELWVLYAEVLRKDESVESYGKQRDLLFKAHRTAVNKPGWEVTLSSCERVVAILHRLLTVTIASQSKNSVTAIRMAANGTVTVINRTHPDSNMCKEIIDKITHLDQIYKA